MAVKTDYLAGRDVRREKEGHGGHGAHGAHSADLSRAGRRYSLPAPCLWLRAPEVGRQAALVRASMAVVMRARKRADSRMHA